MCEFVTYYSYSYSFQIVLSFFNLTTWSSLTQTLLTTAYHISQTVRGTELVMHTQPCHVKWDIVKVELYKILVTWWKDLSLGFNSSIQTGTLCSLGDGSETRQIYQRLSGYFLNIGTRTETLLKVKPNLM